ncbi:MAG: hypothetical protein AAFV90_24355 [Cyanobacteria bacterium J06634_5]
MTLPECVRSFLGKTLDNNRPPEVPGTATALLQLVEKGKLTLEDKWRQCLVGCIQQGETLAILNNLQASALTERSFERVADVSHWDDVIAFI